MVLRVAEQLNTLLCVVIIEALNLRLLLTTQWRSRLFHNNLKGSKSTSLLDLLILEFFECGLLIRLQDFVDLGHHIIIQLPDFFSDRPVRQRGQSGAPSPFSFTAAAAAAVNEKESGRAHALTPVSLP